MSGFAEDLRARTHHVLRDITVDVLILGGGINGAGIARELGLRKQAGLAAEVAVVEQRHFASGTSGKNSQLIHGGLRYLRNLQVGLVKEALRERAVVRKLAPHLVEPLAFLMPIYSRLDKIKFGVGLRMYDQLAGDHGIARHREVSKAEILETEPDLQPRGLVGGAIFYDCIVHSARFVLENLFDAAANGVMLANYTQARLVEREKDGTWRLEMEDMLEGSRWEARAKKVVDATGAWSDGGGQKPVLVRGSHLILPRLVTEEHAIAYFDDKGRIVFFIPWGSHRQLTLLGTTEVLHEQSPDDPRISPEEQDYLIDIAHRVFPNASLQPTGAFSSLRHLLDGASGPLSSASREHRIFNSADGVLRIIGGKYTTYRAMSEEAVAMILKEIAPWLSFGPITAGVPLCGTGEKELGRLRSSSTQLAEKHGVAPVEVEGLIREYGMHTPQLLESIPAEGYGPISRLECGRMAHAVRYEMAQRLVDVMYISSYLGFERRWDAEQLEPYAELMGAWLNWDQARIARETLMVRKVTALPGDSF